MIHDQCSAYCQCSFCANKAEKDGNNGETNILRISKGDCDAANMTKDELYAKSLRDSLRTRAMLASSKNASKFIPDEQLLSSAKRREAKETAIASQVVPLRRRDRLEELLVLEHKARLREEARLRAERRAAGFPDEDEDAVVSVEGTSVPSVPPTPASGTSSQKRGSGASTPASACSADHDLRAALRNIKDIVDSEPVSGPQKPLSREQVGKLRQLVHNQEKKNRAQVENCENQPHLCNHCFSVNVQARYLCPQMTGSIAYAQTGKVINPEEGVKYGTDSKRGLDGSYAAAGVDQRLLSSKGRVSSYNPHPYGTGVVFLPPQSTDSGKQQRAGKSVRFEPTFNNNIGDTEAVEADMQFPGSTYNVYDSRADEVNPANPTSRQGNITFIDSGNSNRSSQNSLAGGAAAVAAVPPGKDGKAAASLGAPVDYSNNKTTSSMWRTTNQARDADMARFVEYQKAIKANSKKVYESTATRSV